MILAYTYFYFDGNLQLTLELPPVKYFADKICLSPNYFGGF